MNFYFKFYRSNIFFEKAIRYNEIYFSDNNELNDPHDLNVKFKFDDSPELWGKVLNLKTEYNNRVFQDWSLDVHFDIKNKNLLDSINEIFKDIIIDGKSKSLNDLIDSKLDEIKNIFEKYKLGTKTDTFGDIDSVNLLPTFLKQKLTNGTNSNLYSASFTSEALNPLMWAHYADGFKGCVVIYAANEDKQIHLRNHYQSKEYFAYKFEKVSYINGDKNICILNSALKNNKALIDACKQKNSFWYYESEYRLLTSISIDPLRKAYSTEDIYPIRERIMYHDHRAIIGVIFGPRCTKSYKSKIDMILRDNHNYSDNPEKIFFLFNTDLSTNGEIKIISAERNCDETGLKELYNDGKLEELLKKLGIKKTESKKE